MDDRLLIALVFQACSALLQSVVWGVLLAAVVQYVLFILKPRMTASSRFAVWFVTLVGVAAMPFALLLQSEAFQSVWAYGDGQQSPTGSAAAEPLISLPVTDDGAGAMLAMWGSAVTLMMLRLLISYFRVRRLKRKAIDTPPEAQTRFARWCEQIPGWRPVRLLISQRAKSPMAVGFRHPAIVLPEALLVKLTGEEFDHLGLHELAHIRRGDHWANLTERVIQAVFFFNPAVHWICSRLDFEREAACDDHVVHLSGAAKPYVKSLARVIELAPWHRGPILASGAVFRNRQILKRIEALLNGARTVRPHVSPVTVLVAVLCVFGVLSEVIRTPEFISFTRDNFGPRQHSRWNMNGRTIDLDMRGEVEFAPDSYSVRAISPNGSLRLREGGSTRRELEIVNDHSGSGLTTRYSVNGRERDLDQVGRAWATSVLAFTIRESGANAEERALALYRTGGVAGALDEIDRIGSDHSRRMYLFGLLDSGKLTPEELRRVIARVSRLGADHERAELLLSVAETFNADDLQPAWFDAVASIGSDHEIARVLSESVEKFGVGKAQAQLGAVRAARRIRSDHDKANVLTAFLERGTLTDETIKAIARAADDIGSDHERSRVLSSMVKDPSTPAAGNDLLRTASRMTSDHEKANVLIQLTTAEPGEEYERAVASIGSSSEKRRVLEALIAHGESPASAKSAARIAATLTSDEDKSQVLEKVATKNGADPEVRALVRAAAEKIGSDSGYRRVASSLLKSADRQ